MKLLLAGGSGLVGRALSRACRSRGDAVTVVTRSPQGRVATAGLSYAGWDAPASGYDAVVSLAGEPVLGRRWSARQLEVLRTSRVDRTRQVVDALRAAEERPPVFVCASAVGYYGDRGDELLSEDSTAGPDFLAELCRDWEAEAAHAEELGVRVVQLRIGVVLAREGGALAKMLLPFRLGLGGPIGAGAHWMSWITNEDLCRLILYSIEAPALSGPVNGVAPEPVTNRVFTRALGRALRRPAFLPVPRPALRLALGGVAAILTASQRCSAEKALGSGFRYETPSLEAALARVLG